MLLTDFSPEKKSGLGPGCGPKPKPKRKHFLGTNVWDL